MAQNQAAAQAAMKRVKVMNIDWYTSLWNWILLGYWGKKEKDKGKRKAGERYESKDWSSEEEAGPC